MSTFAVTIAVGIDEEGPYEEMEALVDTGVFYCWIPRSVLERLSVRPSGIRTFVLATGEEVDEQTGYAWIRLDGQAGPTIVVFARNDSKPLLGAYTLEGFALAAHPVNERLVPMPKLPAYNANIVAQRGLGPPRG